MYTGYCVLVLAIALKMNLTADTKLLLLLQLRITARHYWYWLLGVFTYYELYLLPKLLPLNISLGIPTGNIRHQHVDQLVV